MISQLNKAILVLAIGTLAADASAIKGYSRSSEDAARSIKLASASNTIDKSAQVAPPAPVQQAPKPISTVPILESSKKVYNDESIRRFANVQQQPVQPVVEQAPAAVKSAAPSVVEPVVAPQPQQSAAPTAPVEPEKPVVAPVVPKKEDPIVEPAKVAAAPAQIEARSAIVAPAKPVEKEPEAKVEPQQMPQERSAVVKDEKPIVAEQAPKVAAAAAPVAPEVKPAASQVVVPVAPAVPVQAPVEQPVVKPVAEVPNPIAESVLEAKKSYVAGESANEPLHIEVPAPDPGLVLSEPIDSTTKLLIDLDEHVQTFLPAEQQHQPTAPKEHNLTAGVDYSPPSGKSSAPLVPYSSSNSGDEPIVPPMPSLDGVEKASGAAVAAAASAASAQASAAAPSNSASSSPVSSPSATRQAGQPQNQQQVITQLLDQLDSLQNRIQDTINQLVARRRYVMSALLRPMGTYVRRVRTNLERLQNRVNQLQAAASSVGGPNNQNRPGGFVDAAAIETIRKRIDDISKRISDIVNRIRFSMTPTSAPLNNNGR